MSIIYLLHQFVKIDVMKKIISLKKSIVGIAAICLFLLNSSISYAGSSTDNGKWIAYYTSDQFEDGHNIQYRQERNKYQVRVDGEITISKNDKDITAISRGGYLEIKRSSFGNSRKIVIESVGGKLIKKYYVGYSKKNFSPEGKNWLAEILPEIVRTSMIGAKSRVDRFYKKGGVSAVLGELDSFDSDYFKAAYIDLLLEKKLKNNGLISVLNGLRRYVESDHHIAKILLNNQKVFISNDKVLEAYLNTVNKINSDHYIITVLSRAIKDESISDKALDKIFDNLEQLDSDYYLDIVLNEYIDYRPISKQSVDKVLELSANMNSEHYKLELYKRLMKKSEVEEIGIGVFFPYISKMDSDHLANTLSFIIDNNFLNKENVHEILELSSQIQSDNCKYMIYNKIVPEEWFEEEGFEEEGFTYVKDFDSDYYKVEILKNLIKNSSSLKISTDEILPLVSDISSDNYLVSVLNYLVDQMPLSEQNVHTIFDHTKGFQFDHYKLQLFSKVVNKISIDKKMAKTLFDYIRNEIESENYKIEALNQIINRNKSNIDLTNETLNLLDQFRSEQYIYSLIHLVGKQEKLTEDQLIEVIDSVSQSVNSDHYLTEILIYLSKRVSKSSEKVKESYLKCAKSIHNEYYYRRALKAINKEL
jgi:hypothetical protein